jgi:hypothetical protein
MFKKIRFLFLVIGFTLLTMLFVFSVKADENPTDFTSPNLSPTVKLGPTIDIWMDDVNNSSPAVAYNNHHDEYMVVWYNDRDGGARDIYARRVRGDGTLLSSFTVAQGENIRYYDPDIAYSPKHDEYLVVYTYDIPGMDDDIRALRVNWDGSWISSEIQIGRPDKSGNQVHPAVAYNSQADEYLVVYENKWIGPKDIDAQRVRASDGAILSWRNIATGPAELRSFPDVAYSPGDDYYLIVYTYQPSSSTDPGDILGKVTSLNMSYLSAEIEICSDANDQKWVSLDGSADEFLVAWEDSPSTSTREIYARRVASDGTPLGPSGGFWIAGSPGSSNGSPKVAYGAGGAYLIAWHHHIFGSDYDIFARFAMPGRDSALGSEFLLDDHSFTQLDPVLACSSFADCLMAHFGNVASGVEFDIRGRLVMLNRVFLPISIRGH